MTEVHVHAGLPEAWLLADTFVSTNATAACTAPVAGSETRSVTSAEHAGMPPGIPL